ncbi:PD40 domain-containing protein, partial [bacterium]|nr:PD40 domain-containing protein [bacterium]
MKTNLSIRLLMPLIFCSGQLAAHAGGGTRFLTQPTISGDRIVFAYAGDLWTADTADGNARQLTSNPGNESHPVFSPDGETIAFSGEYDGNIDVFTVPAEGGAPRRLTWHPGPDIVRGFTRDGSKVLFCTPRSVFTRRYTQLYTVSIGGGFPENAGLPNAHKGSYSPDGLHLAYVPIREVHHQWKNYRGGSASFIWLYTFADRSVEKIPQPEGRCNDTDPMWLGDRVYFLSDRSGEFNLFSYDVISKTITRHTNHTDFPILHASGSGDKIIYEQAGVLHVFSLTDGQSVRLPVTVAADLAEVRTRFVKGAKYIREADLSPTGVRAVFNFRGEIVTLPAEKGDPRNLTQSPAGHERAPVWSPDGKSIAFFSDAAGEYELHVMAQDGKSAARKYKLSGSGFYGLPVWAPDSRKIAFEDNGRTLYWINLDDGKIKTVATESLYIPGAFGEMGACWAHDSKWILYTLHTDAFFRRIFAYSTDTGKSEAVSDGMSDASSPVFDPGGRYAYFFSSTDAGPLKHWFDQSNADMRMTQSIYLATLQQ